MTAAVTTETTQVHRVWIKATPEAIWDAITKPEWIDRYGYGGLPEYEQGLQAGSPYVTNAGTGMQAGGLTGPVIDGEIVEADPPRKLVQTWRMLMDPELESEGFTRLTWEIEPEENGVTRLTVSHELEGAPRLALLVGGAFADGGPSSGGGGWAWVLSDLKSLLETGATLAG
jgi:uncharacterized protein YndB with AHSA1/START domain